jgi:hypothetical protein
MQQNVDLDPDVDNDVSDYVSSMNISIKRGTAYLRKTNVRTKAYAELYYEAKDFWNMTYYAFHFSLIGIGMIQSLAILILKILNYDTAITYVGATAGALVAAGSAAMMVVNSGSETQMAENAGDDYSSISEDLELFDPQSCTVKDVNSLVKMASKRIKKIKKKYQEPDRHKFKKKKEEIVALIRAAKESLLYLDAEAHFEEGVELLYNNSPTPPRTPTNNTTTSSSEGSKANSADIDLADTLTVIVEDNRNQSSRNLTELPRSMPLSHQFSSMQEPTGSSDTIERNGDNTTMNSSSPQAMTQSNLSLPVEMTVARRVKKRSDSSSELTVVNPHGSSPPPPPPSITVETVPTVRPITISPSMLASSASKLKSGGGSGNRSSTSDSLRRRLSDRRPTLLDLEDGGL